MVSLTINSPDEVRALLAVSLLDPVPVQVSINGVNGQTINISRAELQRFVPVLIPRTVNIGQAYTTGALNLRSSPGGLFVKVIAPGSKLLVLDTPLVQATMNGTTYVWAAVEIAYNIKGWVVEKYLSAAATVPPTITQKLGLHMMGSLSEADIQKAISVGAAVYKIVDNVGLAQRIHAALPDAAIIFRRYKPDGYWLNLAKQNVGNAVNQYVYERQSDFTTLPFAYHESDNEVGAPSEYLAFEAARARAMAAIGRRACVLNIQTGSTDISTWRNAVDMLKACEEGDHLIGIHGYAQSILSNNYGGSYVDSAGAWHGDLYPSGTSQEAWTAMRWRRDLRDIESLGFYRCQLVITETGLDDLVQPGNGVFYLGGQKTRGWLSCVDAWSKAGFLSGINATEFYRRQLAWLNSQYQLEPRLKGGTLFTYGTDDPQWAQFDTRSLY